MPAICSGINVLIYYYNHKCHMSQTGCSVTGSILDEGQNLPDEWNVK